MNIFYKLKVNLKMALAIFIVGACTQAFGQLSGTYTIDNGSATGGTNFANWTDFRSSIVTNGVNGAVIVNVVTDITEAGQISFPAITGTYQALCWGTAAAAPGRSAGPGAAAAPPAMARAMRAASASTRCWK